MGKKETIISHNFKGVNCAYGDMICKKCNKKIDPMTHDFQACRKSLKNFDWAYVVRHRDCTENQKGWLEIEREKKLFLEQVTKIKNDLNEYKDREGNFSNAFYQALDDLGFEYD